MIDGLIPIFVGTSLLWSSFISAQFAIPKKDDNAEAIPKKLKNPQISVTVVKIIEEDFAGS